MSTPRHRRLLELLSRPTAPFREQHVSRHITALLEARRVPFFEDPIGNLVLGVASAAAYQRLLAEAGGEPLPVFIAHMDHPGFHGERWLDSGRLAVRWHGGSPVRHLRGARVRLVTDENGVFGTGTLQRVRIRERGGAIETAEVRLGSRPPPGLDPAAVYGAFDFRAPVWEDGDRIYCPAADDLVGVHAIIETALSLCRGGQGPSRPFIGLLTRAEEVGFVGAIGHLELGWLQARRRPVFAVSLEASRTLPGAEIGKGPVVRLGDRRTVFDPAMLEALSRTAERTLGPGYQRRVMGGGSCEGTAMTAWGIPTAALSVPLGNYHNQGFEGGDDCRGPEGPAPEFVSREDVEGLVQLCRAIVRPVRSISWVDPWEAHRRRLTKNLARLKKLL